MSYNGVGLSTPRGSGTNGHITRNLSNLRPREKFDDRGDAKDLYTHRAPDAGILEHERRRRVEVKCLELEVSLQDDGVEEDLVEAQVAALREKLLAASASANGTERERGSIKPHERHELGQAKALQNERLRLAMGISKDHVEGLAFDREAQAQMKVQKQEEREKAREERAKIEAQLVVDREKAAKERERLRKIDDENIAKARQAHEARLAADATLKQQRAQDDMRRMDAELDERRAPPAAGRESYDRPAAFDRQPARDEPLPYGGKRDRSPPRSVHSSSRRSPPPHTSDRRRDDSPRRRDDSPPPRNRRRDDSPPPRRDQRSPSPPPRRRASSRSRSRSRSRSPAPALARSISPPPRRRGRSPTRSISRSPSRSRSRSRSPAPRRRARSYSRSVSRSPRARSYSRSRSPPRRRARRDSPSPRRRSPSPGVGQKGGWVRR